MRSLSSRCRARVRVAVCLWLWLCAAAGTPGFAAEPPRPNVLFIALDDLNDWVGCLGGHPQARTPNIDRLARSGVLFTNAHCPAPACNPSRSAIFTGISPHVSGLYANEQKMRMVLPDAELLPRHFARHGYWAAGSGKMLHYLIDARSWDDYYPPKESENPFPPHIDWGERPKSLPRGGPWQYVETDWHAFDVTDEEFGGDVKVAEHIADTLGRPHDRPIFLACGIYRPHEPWFVPKKYFDLFPLEQVALPPGYMEDDLDDLPESGKRAGPNRYFQHIRAHGQWRRAIQGYLASIAFADAMVGRVLDALERSPHRDNTVVVLWSDHGWQLGEKQHWQKFTCWRAVTRVPLVVRVPPHAAPALPAGTTAGDVCSRPVSLISLYPTLTELCGLPPNADAAGASLVPLLRDPAARWPHSALTFAATPGTFSISGDRWRYIRYADGGEELYDIENDPYEWHNLAREPRYAGRLAAFRDRSPHNLAPLAQPGIDALPKLEARSGKPPPSRPEGGRLDVVFINRSDVAVELRWVDRSGNARSYGLIPAGSRRWQQSRQGAVWQVVPLADGADPAPATIGGNARARHFVIGNRTARAEFTP